MYKFHLISLFPEIFSSFLQTSLVGKAIEGGLIGVEHVDPRDFTSDRHRTVDDTPCGGGDGMVMKPEPAVDALESLPGGTFRVLLSPQGEPLTQAHLEALRQKGRVALLCGRYEGFDERIRPEVDLEISLGDFVMCGGEVAAMAIMEGIARLVPGVLGNAGSIETESHRGGLLEYPQYTRPREFRGQEVPEVLLGGNHEQIRLWRREQMLHRTRRRRPDLWASYSPTDEDIKLLGEDRGVEKLAARSHIALLHHPVHDRKGTVVTTAVTNLDLHDIARSSRSYGLAGYHVVTPLSSQQELVERILTHWRTGHGALANKRRAEALALIQVASDLQEVREGIKQQYGKAPLTVVTSAIAREGQVDRQEVLARLEPDQPLLLLLGTGWGLTDEALAQADLMLRPIRGAPDYNHLSVRSAAAILLDRFFAMVH